MEFQPSFNGAEGTHVPEEFLLGGPIDGKSVVVAVGEDFPAGTVLGKATLGAASSAAKSGGNTGGGTLTLDATTPILARAKPGVYTVRCSEVVDNGGKFVVINPEGVQIGLAIVGTAFANEIKFALADVGTDFALGDGFDITIAAGTGYYKKAVSTAVDGSATPDAISGELCATPSAIKTIYAYTMGSFDENSLTFGSGLTAASVKEALRLKNIHLQPAVVR